MLLITHTEDLVTELFDRRSPGMPRLDEKSGPFPLVGPGRKKDNYGKIRISRQRMEPDSGLGHETISPTPHLKTATLAQERVY